MEGVNFELHPLLQMSTPAGLRGRSLEEVRNGEFLGRSWLLAFGFLPVEYDDMRIAELRSGYGFLEDSTLLTLPRWRHERTLEDVEGGTKVSDTLTYQVRFPFGLARVAIRFVLRHLFAHRHRRLLLWAQRASDTRLDHAGRER